MNFGRYTVGISPVLRSAVNKVAGLVWLIEDA
jgi:hypothetical protein